MWVDPLTQDVWVVNPTGSHPSVSAARNRKVVSTYELYENQTQSVIALSFSKKARETAAAKLKLFSKVKGTKRQDIEADLKNVLSGIFENRTK